jgi:hypothetical protein
MAAFAKSWRRGGPKEIWRFTDAQVEFDFGNGEDE